MYPYRRWRERFDTCECTMSKETTNEFESSDSVRSAQPLEYVQTFTLSEPLKLELGGERGGVTVAYETYGQLNARKDNAVLICHALSGDSHVTKHDEDDDPGWWDIAVGPAKCIDTDKYFVICPNVLGGCRGTTGPNCINPATGNRYGEDFPSVTVADQAEVELRLIDHLGIEKLLAVTGGSMGGHRVLHWGAKLSERVRGAIPIATSARLTSQALGFDVVGRNAILRDPKFLEGQYYDEESGPEVGLAIARMVGHITYLSREAMAEKFGADRFTPRNVSTEFEKKFSVGSYLAYRGAKFVEIFDANSYITLTRAMDMFDMGSDGEELAKVFAPSQSRWLVISFTSDWLFPADQSQQIVDALIATNKSVSYCNVVSSCGHDAFLLPNDLDRYGELIRAFLGNLDRDGAGGEAYVPSDDSQKKRRLDYDLIIELSEPAHSILDLGCGTGELLSRLKRRGHNRAVGVDLDEEAVIASVQRGVDVIQADLNKPLSSFSDGQFDFVVLSLTLQAIKDVEGIVSDMLRVGQRCIVTFPNFAYRKFRQMLSAQGLAPVGQGILRYEWYNSPNIRFFSIADFENFCKDRKIQVHRRLTLDTEAATEVYDDPNLNADLAIFVISR